jgi:stalled ribosome rescue protein Dom34
MTHYHAVVWLDHAEARIFAFNAEDAQEATLHPDHPHVHLHHKAGVTGAGKSGLEATFARQIVDALTDFGEILIVGPGSAKTELSTYIGQHDQKLKSKVVGIETVDHPSDGQIVAFARKYFRAADRMRH